MLTCPLVPLTKSKYPDDTPPSTKIYWKCNVSHGRSSSSRRTGEGACNYVYTAKFKHGCFFSHKRSVLLNIVTVDTKHSRKSAMFEFCRLRSYMLPHRFAGSMSSWSRQGEGFYSQRLPPTCRSRLEKLLEREVFAMPSSLSTGPQKKSLCCHYGLHCKP